MTASVPREVRAIEHPTSAVCPSCGSADINRFCADCGEKMLTGHDFSLWRFLAHDLPHETFHFDGKVPSTLRKLLAQPGFLPAEYIAGRRVRYVNPLRLYLLVFVVYALITSLLAHSNLTLPQKAAIYDPTGWVAHLAADRPAVNWDDAVLKERITTRMHWLSEGGTFLIFLCLALVQQLVFWRSRRRYLEHALLGVSVATFCMLVVLVQDIVLRIAGAGADAHEQAPSPILQISTMAVLLVYWYFALLRFYRCSRVAAAAAAVAIAFAQTIIAIALNIGVLALLVVTA